MGDCNMKTNVKKFVTSAFKAGKSRSYVRESLFKKVSDVKAGKALRLFDRLSMKEKHKRRFSLTEIPKLIFYSLRLTFFFSIFIFLWVSLGLKRIFLGGSEDVTLEDVKHSFSFAILLKRFKAWFSKKSRGEKIGIILFCILALLVLSLVIFSSFIFHKSCENSSCFREMMSNCHRAQFISSDLVPLDNKIMGYSIGGCKVEVTSLKNDFGIGEGKKMVCYFPKGSTVLPQTNIEFCSGDLREDIQEVIISELYKTIGQNINELNDFFKV